MDNNNYTNNGFSNANDENTKNVTNTTNAVNVEPDVSSQNNYYGSANDAQQNGTYQQVNGYQQGNPYQQEMPKAKNKKPRKKRTPNGFGVKLGKCAAIALVFGLVAGTAFTGVNYVGNRVLGVSEKSASASDDRAVESSANIQPTATGYAKDLVDVSSIVE